MKGDIDIVNRKTLYKTYSCVFLLQNNRTARTLTVSYSLLLGKNSQSTGSRSCAISRYDANKMADDSFALMQEFNTAPANQSAWYVSNQSVC